MGNKISLVNIFTVLWACRMSSFYEQHLGQGCNDSVVEAVCSWGLWRSNTINTLGFTSPMQPLCKMFLPPAHSLHWTRDYFYGEVGLLFVCKLQVVSSARCGWWHVEPSVASVPNKLRKCQTLWGVLERFSCPLTPHSPLAFNRKELTNERCSLLALTV